MRIKSFVGGHDVVVYANATYDEKIRKYRNGNKVFTIPFSGTILSAKFETSEEETIDYDGNKLFVYNKRVKSVDPIPSKEECDLCLVSNLYAQACKELGLDTSRLITIGDSVVDDNGTVIGAINFIQCSKKEG